MKNLLFFVSVLSLLLCSCSQNNDAIDNDQDKSIVENPNQDPDQTLHNYDYDVVIEDVNAFVSCIFEENLTENTDKWKMHFITNINIGGVNIEAIFVDNILLPKNVDNREFNKR